MFYYEKFKPAFGSEISCAGGRLKGFIKDFSNDPLTQMKVKSFLEKSDLIGVLNFRFELRCDHYDTWEHDGWLVRVVEEVIVSKLNTISDLETLKSLKNCVVPLHGQDGDEHPFTDTPYCEGVPLCFVEDRLKALLVSSQQKNNNDQQTSRFIKKKKFNYF